MREYEKRLSKIENKVFNNKHHGVFYVVVDKDTYRVKDETIIFNSQESMETYILNKYDCDKYVFITFDLLRIKIPPF